MSVTLGWVLLNTAYLIYTASGLFKDMLKLRVVWLLSTLFFIAHGLVDQLWPAVWWNVPVLMIHFWMIGSLLFQRRAVNLDDEALAIGTLIFPGLDRVGFNTLWQCGQERKLANGHRLIIKGEPVPMLTLILDGNVDVEISNDFTLQLSEYRLLGEVSSLSGEVANASVTAAGEVRVRVWDKDMLDRIAADQPGINVALLKAMGHEAARKLN